MMGTTQVFDEEFESDSDTDGSECDGKVDPVRVSLDDITEEQADRLYEEAGGPVTVQGPAEPQLHVLPEPIVLYTEAETLIMQAKAELGISYDLEPFQIQALLGMVKIYVIYFITIHKTRIIL